MSTQTHCHRGHAFDGANTKVRPNGTRACRACRAARERLRRAGLAVERRARRYVEAAA